MFISYIGLGVARGCIGSPGQRKKFVLAGESWRVGVVNLACVLTTTKKVVSFLRKKVHPRENPGYAYVYNQLTHTARELFRILAGPFSTMILGDMGAEVIKVEKPGVKCIRVYCITVRHNV